MVNNRVASQAKRLCCAVVTLPSTTIESAKLSNMCVCAPLLRPGAASAIRRIRECATKFKLQPTGRLPELAGGGGTLGTNSLRFSCSIAANKPAASNCRSLLPSCSSSSSSNSSSNQRLVNNYLCTSKLQTHEIEIRHRQKLRQTQRQRQRPPKQLKMKNRKAVERQRSEALMPYGKPFKTVEKKSFSANLN